MSSMREEGFPVLLFAAYCASSLKGSMMQHMCACMLQVSGWLELKVSWESEAAGHRLHAVLFWTPLIRCLVHVCIILMFSCIRRHIKPPSVE